MKFIEFKTKPFPIRQGIEPEAPVRMAISWKKRLERADCNLRPHEHAYYNSDLFAGFLNRFYRRVVGENAEYCYLDALPDGVSVDTGKFLAVVRLDLPANFR